MKNYLAISLVLASVALPTQATAESARLSIVQVNDLYQLAEENGRGGMARLATVLKTERAAGKHVLFVHAGDAFSPSLMSGFDHGESMVALLNELKPDVFVPGNHEFDFGKTDYLARVAQAQFPFFAANLRDSAGNLLPKHQDHTIIDVDGIKVGISGAALDETAVISSPDDLKFASTYETVASQAKAMKMAGADLTITVVHANLNTVWKMYGARLSDVILSGHNHDLRVEYDGRSAMTESGHDAQYVMITDLSIDKTTKDGKTKVTWKPNFRIVDTSDVKPDEAVAAKVKAYDDQLGKELDVAVATLVLPLDSRTDTVRGGESAMGNLIADAMRAATGADISITNGGGIRGNKLYLATKQITRRDILTELPFGNKTVLVRIKGEDLLTVLEAGVAKLPDFSGGFPQVSGMKIQVSLGKPTGGRVANVTIGGKPLDPVAEYSLATNDYMLAGGDGYTALAKAKVIRPADAAMLIANDVMVHAKKLNQIAVQVEGRTLLVK
jgi:5'-nucleotidase / UDP-sugar diphosphatase